ncbi:MAG: nickel-responsive transcriptional regulator NikR [Gemmataceae bacterium]|nr:nickel-responsive transcriptional regulator NikR [Gemmataceae bacterium]
MSQIARFTVSIETDLLEDFDRFCTSGKFATRSEAVRQIIREKLTSNAWESGAENVVASLTLVYDHHRSRLTDQMIEIQHSHGNCVVSSMHVHLTHELCMELIALRGSAHDLEHLAAELSGLKGIHQAKLVIVGIGAEQKPTRHSHRHHKH